LPGKKRIAFLTENIYEGYQSYTWPGAAQAAEELGYDLFFFPGEEPNVPNINQRQHNIIYSFLTSFPLDGFIIVSNTFGRNNTPRQLEEFIKPFRHIPHVSIGTPLGDAPTIMIDQKTGLEKLLEHLLSVHKFKKIAYIRGPLNHPEAEIRYQTFLQMLKKYNLPFDDFLLYVGNFLIDSGEKAIKEWMEHGHKNFDAVIAASDFMAIGAHNALEKYGLKVPDDVALAGFDDVSESRFLKAPLTTVSQPLFKISHESVCLLDQIISGKKITKQIFLPTEAVIRRSCGCLSAVIQNIGKTTLELPKYEQGAESNFIQLIVNKYAESSKEFEDNIVKIVQVILKSSHKDSFFNELIGTLDQILAQEVKDSTELYIWQDIFTEIFAFFSKHLQATVKEDISILMQKVRVFIGELLEKRQVILKFQSITEYRNLYSLLIQLSNALEKEKIAKIINENLHKNGIAAFFLMLYEKLQIGYDEKVLGLPEKSRLFAGFGNNGKTIITDNSPFPTKDLLKQEWLKNEPPGIYVVHPLVFEKTHMGYMVAKMGPKNGLIYESLRVQLTSSLQSAIILEEKRKNEQTVIEKGERIQSVIMPMLTSINQVSGIAVSKIEDISKLIIQTEQSSQKLREANKSVERISENVKEMISLINMIDDISMRINLLSINTSIQSARAGEHGKGFAIIALEIRKLADSTAANAKQTAETLKNVVDNIHQSQSTSEESVASFMSLKDEINAVSHSLTEISKQMETLSSSSQKIFEMIK
jgi:DNA-binding LacI/PurR family transcriptional regulator